MNHQHFRNWTFVSAVLMILALCAPLGGPAARADEAPSADSQAIHQVFERFNDALNRHDAHAVAALCTTNVDFIVIGGEDLRGRAETERHLIPLFAGMLKHLQREASIQEVRLLRPDVAILVADFTTSGIVSPAGATVPPAKGVYDWVLVKRGDQWMISLWHEANLPMRPARRG